MYKLFSIFIFLNLSTLTIAQTTLRTVKVSVNEIIELKSVKAVYSVNVQEHRDQLSDYMDEEYSEYGEGSHYEEPISYQEVEDGKMTDEQYRQKMNEFYQQKEKEEQEKRANFVSVSDKDIMALLKKNKLNYTIQSSISQNRYYEDDSDLMDTTIFITVLSAADYDRMVSVLINQPAYFRLSSLDYEPIETHLEKTIPVLTQKAKKEASALASSLGKKLGDIVECSNDKQHYPISENYDRVDQYERNLFVNPFEKTQLQSIQYIYTFELL